MKQKGPWEQKWKKLMMDGYKQAERDAYWEKVYKQEIKRELARREAKESGSWWKQFLWDIRYGVMRD